MKYTDTQIGFQEFPDEISLLINISNCPHHCSGCHSPELWEDVGIELNTKSLNILLMNNKGISCVGFMGGDSDLTTLEKLVQYIREWYPKLKVGWYSGFSNWGMNINVDLFDYIKLGPYIKERGGLNNPNTNQRFFIKGNLLHKIDANPNRFYDITDNFWKHDKG